MRGVESNENDFLDPDVAFRVGAAVDGNVVRVRWVIADGYYLYRHKIEIKAESPDLVVSTPMQPAGALKTDPYLGTMNNHGAVVAGPHVVLTGVHQLDRRSGQTLGNGCRFATEMRVRGPAPPERPTGVEHVERDLLRS